MPKIDISKKELEKLIGKKIDIEKLGELLILYVKADIDNIEGDTLSIKLEDTNRPDLWSIEGIARQIKNLLGITSGFEKYKVNSSEYVVNVEEKKVENTAPFIGCAVFKNVKLNDIMIKLFMQMQDKLDVTYGRKRKKASIGFYDFDKVSFPVLYTSANPEHLKFKPLGFSEEMSLKKIIEKHPKGIEYGHLVKNNKEYPILIDSKSQVLSIPAVINSDDLGNINENTKSILVDVTGTDYKTVMNTLGIITIALAEHGADIYEVTVNYKKKKEKTPDLKPIELSFKPSGIKKILGIELSDREIKKILEKMGYRVLSINQHTDKALIEAPFYRQDIMHDVDIIEDIAIGYGYNEFETVKLKVATEGDLNSLTKKTDLIRDVMTGIGCQEILSFMLTNKNTMFEKMNQVPKNIVEIENPISSNWGIIRDSLMPVVINFLAINKTVEFPQKIFEIGDVVSTDEKMENRAKQSRNLCAAISHPRVTFTEIKSVLDKLCSDLSVEHLVKPVVDNRFIEGRCGEIIVNSKQIGIIGELHPQILENFGLENPIALFELNVEEI